MVRRAKPDNNKVRKKIGKMALHSYSFSQVLILVVILVTPSTANSNFPPWLGGNENTTTMGILCELDNDEIGQKLGCDCKYPPSSPATDLIADCQSKQIGTDKTPLPPYLNVSHSVRTLNFAKNGFTILSPETFGDVDGIYKLIFSHNLIQSVIGLTFPRLIKIDLSHNFITNLTDNSFNCPKLEEIDLSYNQLLHLDVKQFRSLRVLNLDSNRIDVDNLEEFPDSLEEVNLNNNSLENFPVIVLASKGLKRLYLRDNQITSIPGMELLDIVINLKELDLSGNRFTAIRSSEFFEFKQLQKLTIVGNKDLKTIEKYAFSGMSSLNELSCQQNDINFIDPMAFHADPEIAKSEKSLPKFVRLAGNSLHYIEFELLDWKDLEELDLKQNPWNCDCNLQWVPTFRAKNSAEAAILIDTDFMCHHPSPVRGLPVAKVDPAEMLCLSNTITIIGICAIIIIGIIMIVFAIFIGMSLVGCLPTRLKKFDLFKSELKYSRVYPKPQERTPGGVQEYEPQPIELEWDSAADIGR